MPSKLSSKPPLTFTTVLIINAPEDVIHVQSTVQKWALNHALTVLTSCFLFCLLSKAAKQVE